MGHPVCNLKPLINIRLPQVRRAGEQPGRGEGGAQGGDAAAERGHQGAEAGAGHGQRPHQDDAQQGADRGRRRAPLPLGGRRQQAAQGRHHPHTGTCYK